MAKDEDQHLFKKETSFCLHEISLENGLYT